MVYGYETQSMPTVRQMAVRRYTLSMQLPSMPQLWKQTPVALVEKRHEHDDVWTFYFAPSEEYTYEAGEYVHVRIALPNSEEKSVREFSFASAPHEKHIQLTVDTRSQSAYQQALCALGVGDEVVLFKNKRHMVWPVPEERIVCIAGGVGVTPFRSMCMDIQAKSLSVHATVVHVERDAFLFQDELSQIAGTYLPVRRALLDDTLREIATEQPLARYYVAGSPTFVDSVTTMLNVHGITHIETDAFKGYVGE